MNKPKIEKIEKVSDTQIKIISTTETETMWDINLLREQRDRFASRLERAQEESAKIIAQYQADLDAAMALLTDAEETIKTGSTVNGKVVKDKDTEENI